MASKVDFTESEWETLRKGVMGAGMLVSIADRDFTDSFGEAKALAERLGDEHAHSESQLVRELTTGRKTGFGLTDSPKEVEAETVEALGSANAILAAKAPDEAAAYRQLVLDVAESVAASKGGVKPAETEVIDKLKEALGSA